MPNSYKGSGILPTLCLDSPIPPDLGDSPSGGSADAPMGVQTPTIPTGVQTPTIPTGVQTPTIPTEFRHPRSPRSPEFRREFRHPRSPEFRRVQTPTASSDTRDPPDPPIPVRPEASNWRRPGGLFPSCT
jgi:hypothetical protein